LTKVRGILSSPQPALMYETDVDPSEDQVRELNMCISNVSHAATISENLGLRHDQPTLSHEPRKGALLRSWKGLKDGDDSPV
ncbi:MAG TPA: hypothetical protein VEY30_13680, partial [Myxococcaceae bacterium]|nr:hypothetical protein [Myxococcaceae bacterium]